MGGIIALDDVPEQYRDGVKHVTDKHVWNIASNVLAAGARTDETGTLVAGSVEDRRAELAKVHEKLRPRVEDAIKKIWELRRDAARRSKGG